MLVYVTLCDQLELLWHCWWYLSEYQIFMGFSCFRH